MFGLSLSKILLTLFVIAAVWYGWRAYNRYQVLRQEVRRRMAEEARRNPKPAAASTEPEAEDTIECATCGAFIAASRKTSCGRKDCPYPD